MFAPTGTGPVGAFLFSLGSNQTQPLQFPDEFSTLPPYLPARITIGQAGVGFRYRVLLRLDVKHEVEVVS